jgi:hypothetical protein
MTNRRQKNLFSAVGMGADTAYSSEIVVGQTGYLSLQVLVDNGSGAAPTDAPIGVLEVVCSGGSRFTQLVGTTVTTELAKVAATGNAKVDAWAVLEGVPGSACKVRYKRTSGGGGNSRLTIDASSW